jgi:hypothetical protein
MKGKATTGIGQIPKTMTTPYPLLAKEGKKGG